MICATCKLSCSDTPFYKCNNYTCKPCLLKRSAEYHKQHKDRSVKSVRKWRNANKAKFKTLNIEGNWARNGIVITVEEYNALFEAQNGTCAICKSTSRKRRLAVDHSHVTGKVRGLLCTYCNAHVVSLLEEKTHLLQVAINYLNSFK